ncbi:MULTISPECIES: YadA-like family protein [unclassified Burkholderia]|nr:MULTISPECIES: YadA-like family protein [unclassified Burkholderia]
MNKSYKVVWNASNGTWAVASEVATSRISRQSSRRHRKQFMNACGRKTAAVTAGVVAVTAMSSGGVWAGTVIAGGGSKGSNIDGGTNQTFGGLSKSYIGAGPQGSVITGDDDCLSLASQRLVMSKANLSWLLGMTSQVTRPDAAHPAPTTINGVQVGYYDANPDIMGGGKTNPMSSQATLAWGFNSFAAGCGNKALGAGSSATGMQNQAKLAGSTASGIGNDAAGAGATAIGLYNVASGTGSTAIGIGSIATGAGSVALGSGGDGAPGLTTVASGEHSIAIGGDAIRGAQAIGDDSIALGSRSRAKGKRAIAVGWSAAVEKAGSVAIGSASVSKRSNEVSVGSEVLKRQITHVADATEASDAVTFGQMNKAFANVSLNGDGVKYDDVKRASVTFGGGAASVPVQLKNVAAGADDTDAINLSQLNQVRGEITGGLADGSLGMRYIKVKASGAHAMAVGANSVAIGSGANATASGALAFGMGARATALNSVAIGLNSVADEANQVSVGDAGHERRISHLAEGVEGNDAVNVNQLSNAIEKIYDRTDKLSSDLKSRKDLLVANMFSGEVQATPSFVAVDGMGADGSLENSASIGDGDPTSVSAAAMGLGSAAAGADAVAVGLRSFALSSKSVAIGNMAATGADQPYSVAIGSEVTTNGSGALAIGSRAKANAVNAIAVGNNKVYALGDSSIAIGDGAQSLEGSTNGVVLGRSAVIQPNVTDAMALGANSSVDDGASSAVALGTGSRANRANTVSVGGGVAGVRQIVNVAAGTQGNDAVNVNQLNGVAMVLGGGAGISADGSVKAPAYRVGDKTYGNVGDAIAAAAESGGGGVDANVVAYDDATKGSITLSGEKGTTLKNVGVGGVSAASTDAVNGSQLFGTSQSVANALGGGSRVDAAGKLTAPTYSLNGGMVTAHTVGEAMSNLDGRVTVNASDVIGLKDQLAESGLVDNDTGKTNAAVTYDREPDGTVNHDSVTLVGMDATSPVALRNVAAGGVSATSTDALNGSQLFGASQSVASVLGGGATVDAAGKLTAPTYLLNGGTVTARSVGEAMSNLDDRVVTNASDVVGLKHQLADSGLVDNETGKMIDVVTYDRMSDGTADHGSVTLIGRDMTSPVALKNVAAGAADTDAVNVGQLNAGMSNVKRELSEGTIDLKYIKVKATGAAAIASGNQAVAIGSRAAAGGQNSLALGAGARTQQPGSVAIGANSVADQAMTVSVGDVGAERKIVNVKKGDVSARSTDAINGSQLYDALGALKLSVATQKSNLLSELNAIAYHGAGGWVAVDGMGADGSLENSASIGDGDPTSVSAAAMGLGSAAAGADAVAVGLRSFALSSKSVAIGNMAATGADQPYSVAIGSEVTTNGSGALAIGSRAKANAVNAIAVGNNKVYALGDSSIAIGDGAQSLEGSTNGVVLGRSAVIQPNVTDAMALGANSSVDDGASSAVALGTGSRANRANTVSVGGGVAGVRQIVNVAAGTQGNDAVNVNQLNGVAMVLGGGAGISADGSVKAPAYRVGDKTYGNVGDAIAAAAESGGGGVDANVVAYDDATKGSITLSGEKGTTLKNVGVGGVSAASTDAVNGSQLFGTAQSVANALGGGASVSEDGTISAPRYSLAGGSVMVNGIGAAISNLDERVTTNSGDISKLTDAIANSGVIDPKTGQPVATVTYDRNVDGLPNRASVTLGAAGNAVGLHNVANGAVTADSLDAVNGSQLHRSAQSIARAIGGDTTVDESGQIAVNSIEVGGHKYSTVSEAVQAAAVYGATDSLAVRYDLDTQGHPNYGSVTLGGPAAGPVILANVADGKNQYDAVNYGQLSSLKSDFENRLDNVDSRIGKIEVVGGESGRRVSDFSAGTGDNGQSLTPANPGNGSNNVAIGSNATIEDGASNATAIGANSAVDGMGGTAIGAASKAHAASSTAIGQSSTARGENSVAIGAGAVANEDNTVSFGDGSDRGNRRIVNIADGVNASDATTKGQLDRAVGGLQDQVNGVSRNAYSGIAAATALTMIPGVDPDKTLSFGIGSASYKGYQAVAFGGEARITKNLKMKAGIGLSSGGNTIGMGASYQW